MQNSLVEARYGVPSLPSDSWLRNCEANLLSALMSGQQSGALAPDVLARVAALHLEVGQRRRDVEVR